MCACLQSSASASDLPYRRLEVVVGLSRPSLSTLARSEASALRGQHPLIEARNPFQAGVQRPPRGQDNVRSPRASQLGQCPENGIPWEWREAGWAGGLSVRLTSVRFSYLFFDGVASVTPRRNIARPADFLRTCEATRLAETALARYSLAAVPPIISTERQDRATAGLLPHAAFSRSRSTLTLWSLSLDG